VPDFPHHTASKVYAFGVVFIWKMTYGAYPTHISKNASDCISKIYINKK